METWNFLSLSLTYRKHCISYQSYEEIKKYSRWEVATKETLIEEPPGQVQCLNNGLISKPFTCSECIQMYRISA